MSKIVTIGIQARSTSIRFPGKIHKMIGDKTILERIVASCQGSETYLNRHSYKNGYQVKVTVCCPTSDELVKKYRGKFDIVEGDESDVLARYTKLAERDNADYIVRVTADCPLIPSFVISSIIMKGIYNGYDYISNVEPLCRTTPDGWDCEVMSRKLLDHVNKHAIKPEDREHVTTYMRENKRNWKHAVVLNHMDLSHIKMSVDTLEEYERVKNEWISLEQKLEIASEIFGKEHVHRL